MILVTGATGSVGGAVARLLAPRRESLRLMVRDTAKAVPLPGAEMVAGDFGDPDSLDRALAAVDCAFLLTPVGEQQATWEANFVDAAVRAGVSLIVKHSAVGADPDAKGVGSAHGVSEHYLQKSGIAAVIVRPVMFMDNLLRWAPPIPQAGALVVPLADRAVRINMISVQDVAAVEAAALTQRRAGRTYTLTGPELMTFRDVAARVSAGVAISVPLLIVDAAEYRMRCKAADVPEADVEGQLDYFSTLTAATTSLTVTTDDVQHVLGRQPMSLRAFAAFHADGLTPRTVEGQTRHRD
jgi:uncharacterized protein YbjT (DUF2867 family)